MKQLISRGKKPIFMMAAHRLEDDTVMDSEHAERMRSANSGFFESKAHSKIMAPAVTPKKRAQNDGDTKSEPEIVSARRKRALTVLNPAAT